MKAEEVGERKSTDCDVRVQSDAQTNYKSNSRTGEGNGKNQISTGAANAGTRQ